MGLLVIDISFKLGKFFNVVDTGGQKYEKWGKGKELHKRGEPTISNLFKIPENSPWYIEIP